MRDLCYAKDDGSDLECGSPDRRGGAAVGIGAGGIFEVSSWARLRADLLLRLYVLEMAAFSNASYGDSVVWTTSGVRTYLFLGGDFL
jgi:hypothetical protein